MTTPVFGFSQHIGRVRPALEDRVRAEVITTQGGLTLTLAMVADGIGGGNFGERAAQLAVDTVFEEVWRSKATRPDHIPRLLRHALRHANSAIYREAQAYKQERGMGSTATIVAIQQAEAMHPTQLFIANVGDSRAYLVRQGQVSQLTRDHSWAVEVVTAGRLTTAEALRHPRADELMRSLGYQPDVEVDVQFYAVEPSAYYLPLLDGDYVVVCTDGLIKPSHLNNAPYVSLDEIANIVTHHTPQQAAEQLVGLALKREVDDNVTVAVIAMGQQVGVRSFSRPVWIVGGIGTISLCALVLLVAIWLVTQRNADQTITATQPAPATTLPVTTTPSPVPVDPEAQIVVFAAGGDALVDSGMGFSPVDTGERLPALAGLAIQSGMTSMELLLPDDTFIAMTSNTHISFVSIRDVAGSPTTHLILQSGQLLMELSVPAGQTNQIVTPDQTLVWVGDFAGVMGVEYDPAGGLLIDCFTGNCHLVNTQNDTLTLQADQLGQITPDDQLDQQGSARYQPYSQLTNNLLPTLTPTPSLTPTDFPVSTWTPRPTMPRPTLTPQGDDA